MYVWGRGDDEIPVCGELGENGEEIEHPTQINLSTTVAPVDTAVARVHAGVSTTVLVTRTGKLLWCGALGKRSQKRLSKITVFTERVLDAVQYQDELVVLVRSGSAPEETEVYACRIHSDGTAWKQMVSELTGQGARQLSASATHCGCLTWQDEVFLWGQNWTSELSWGTQGEEGADHYQHAEAIQGPLLGTGSRDKVVSAPMRVMQLPESPLKQLQCGLYRTFLLCEKEGTVYSWGLDCGRPSSCLPSQSPQEGRSVSPRPESHLNASQSVPDTVTRKTGQFARGPVMSRNAVQRGARQPVDLVQRKRRSWRQSGVLDSVEAGVVFLPSPVPHLVRVIDMSVAGEAPNAIFALANGQNMHLVQGMHVPIPLGAFNVIPFIGVDLEESDTVLKVSAIGKNDCLAIASSDLLLLYTQTAFYVLSLSLFPSIKSVEDFLAPYCESKILVLDCFGNRRRGHEKTKGIVLSHSHAPPVLFAVSVEEILLEMERNEEIVLDKNGSLCWVYQKTIVECLVSGISSELCKPLPNSQLNRNEVPRRKYDFRKVFLLCFDQGKYLDLGPPALLDYLLDIYHDEDALKSEGWAPTLPAHLQQPVSACLVEGRRGRVLRFLLQWAQQIPLHFVDDPERMFRKTLRFITEQVSERLLAPELLELLNDLYNYLLWDIRVCTVPPTLLSSAADVRRTSDILDLDPVSFAHQLTLIDSKVLMAQITDRDIVLQKCQAASQRYGDVFRWAQMKIVYPHSEPDRLRIIEYFLSVLVALWKLQNLFSFEIIMNAVSSIEVRKLVGRVFEKGNYPCKLLSKTNLAPASKYIHTYIHMHTHTYIYIYIYIYIYVYTNIY